MSEKNLCIFGAGGAAKDAYTILNACGLENEFKGFLESDKIWIKRKVCGFDVLPLSSFDPKSNKLVLAIGDSASRKEVAATLPIGTKFFNLLHPEAIISPFVEFGEGCIIGAGSILTIDIKIGNHAYINIATTITHDCRIGDFFTSAPSVNISGNCAIGNCVFLGTNASIREKTTIADNIIVGMGSVVINDLKEPGVYYGVPAKKAK